VFEGVISALDGLVFPEDVAIFYWGQSAHHAQQAGFTDPVGTCDIQPCTFVQRAINALEQSASALAATELAETEGHGDVDARERKFGSPHFRG
jgi:hypothetical protein